MTQGRIAVVERPTSVAQRLVVGLDVAGRTAMMALQGVSSTISARAHALVRWAHDGAAPALWVSPVALETIAAREGGQGARVAAVVAVPGWFGALDRSAVRELLGAQQHQVRVVSAPSAAAVAWARRDGVTAAGRAVLCVDIGYGVSGAVVVLAEDGAREVATAAIAPAGGSLPGGPVRPEVVTALVAQLLRRARSAGAHPVDVALLVGEASDPSVGSLWERVVAAATGAGDVQPMSVVVERDEFVAGGAVLLAGATEGVTEVPLARVVPYPLGAVVDDGTGRQVLTLVRGDAPLPLAVSQAFVADAASPVRLELVEARRPGASDEPGDWAPVATATWLGAAVDLVEQEAGALQVSLELSIDDDGVIAIGPSGNWSIEVADGAAAWLGGAVAPAQAEGRHRHARSEPARGVGAGSATPELLRRVALTSEVACPPARPLAWPATPTTTATTAALATWPPPGVAVVEVAIDEPTEEAQVGWMSVELDDHSLEEIAAAEIGAASLAGALADVERLLSRQFGVLVGLRSVPALLDCDDDADLSVLRAAARRLEQVLSGQPDDALTEAVRAAVRAARRSFADPTRPLFAGGTAEAITADAVRVAEHLELVVGGIAPAERLRIVHDARLRGLARATVERSVAALFGDGPHGLGHDTRAASVLRDAAARLGDGHRGWSLEIHADPDEPLCPETRAGITQVRLMLLEPFPGAA